MLVVILSLEVVAWPCSALPPAQPDSAVVHPRHREAIDAAQLDELQLLLLFLEPSQGLLPSSQPEL